MAKQFTGHDEDLPPSYAEANAPGSLSLRPTDSVTADPALYTTHLTSHLGALPSRIRATQARHQTAQAAQDLELITLLVPEIEAFLSDLASSSPSFPGAQRAELTLVPAAAVGPKWALSGAQERRREGETVQLVRVSAGGVTDGDGKGGKGSRQSDAKGLSSSSSSSEAEPPRIYNFDDWGRWDDGPSSLSSGAATAAASWWWQDEAMARRLAGYLQPKTEPRVDRRSVQTVVAQAKEDRKSSGWGGWGRKKSTSTSTSGLSSAGGSRSSPAEASRTAALQMDVSSGRAEEDDRVTMTVRAEEVSFRRENEFGVYESMSGFGLVVRVTIRRA